MNFIIYSKEGCPYCEKIKKVMDLTKLNHVVYTLNQDFTKEEFYSEFGEGTTFPQIICDGNNLGGCTQTIKFLKEQNIV
jgi:glutaredoxin